MRAIRAFSVVLVSVAGITCRDLPTQPDVAGNGALFSLTGMTITPSLDTLLVTETLALSARNSNGSPINKQTAWTSSDTTVAKVVVTGLSTATLSTFKAGTVTITVTSQNKGGTATIVVVPVPVRSVAVTPDSASVERGDSVQYSAVAQDSAGNALTGRIVVWSTDDTLTARAEPSGLARTIARGTVQVQATVEGVVGSATLTSRLAQLTVSAISTADTANAGDTVVVAYTVDNRWDSPNADSVVVRVGVRSPDGTLYLAQRRAVARLVAGATRQDTVRFALPSVAISGAHTVTAFADCSDAGGATDTERLTACSALPEAAGQISEGDETDNARSATLVVRGPDLSVGTLALPDSMFTRTTADVTVPVSNSGSPTGSGFDVVAGLFDVTIGSYVTAFAVTTPALGSRANRNVTLSLSTPGDLDAGHVYEVRVFADCRNTGADVPSRLQACIANAPAAGEISEFNESNNSASGATAVASNVVRLDAQPDSVLITAIADEAALVATAYDRSGSVVGGVSVTWTSLDPAIAVVNGATVRATAAGVARLVAIAEGRADTTRLHVVQQIASVISTPAIVTLGSLGETTQLAAAALDRNEHAVSGATFVWSSLDAAIASVSSSGLVTANAVGTARIVVASGGSADTTTVTVAQLPARVVATPDSVLATALLDSVRLAATAYDGTGNPIPAAVITWSAPDSIIASVTADGFAVARANGVARIIAGSGGHADTVRVFVQQRIARVIASPDSIVLTSLGTTGQFTAAGQDARSFPVDNAVIEWATLDASIASVTNGIVTGHSVGRARIVATSGGASDTVLAVVEQRAVSVVVSPDTAMVAAGGSAMLSASARDLSGNPIPTADITWSTLDPAVASVTGGAVSGLAAGIARIVAAANGPADTAIVFVNPAGFNMRWLGTRSIAITDSSNWYPHRGLRPDAAVYIPAGTPNQPALTAGLGSQAHVASILVEPGATLSGVAGGTLTTYGNIDIAASVGDFSIQMMGSGTVRGALPFLNVGTQQSVVYEPAPQRQVTATLAGRTQTRALGLTADPVSRGRLIVNGQTLVTSSLFVWGGGEIVQTNAADSVIVDTLVNVSAEIGAGARSQLTAGVMVVGGSYNLSGNGDAFSPSGSHTVQFRGNTVHDLRVDDTTSAALQNVSVQGTLQVWHTATIGGRLTMAPGSRLLSNNDVSLRFLTMLPETDGADYAPGVTNVVGDVRLTRDHSFTGPVWVADGGRLTLGGHTLRARALSTYIGTLVMDRATDTLVVVEGGSFYGIHELSAGTLTTGGTLVIAGAASPMPGARWTVSGSHTVVFDGTQPQTFSVNDTTFTHFQNVEVRNTAGVQFIGTTNVGGAFRLVAGGRAVSDWNAKIKVFSQLPDVSQGQYDITYTSVAGQITATRNESFAQGLSIEGGGLLRLGGRKLVVGMMNVYDGTLVMDTPADTLSLRQGGSFYGRENLTAGTLMIGAPWFSVNPQPGPAPGAAWNVSGSHKIVFDGTSPQTVTLADTTVNGAQDVEVTNPTGVTFSGATNIGGLLKLSGGGRVVGDWNSALRFTTRLPDVSQGSFEVQQAVVIGNITATKNETFVNGLSIDGGGSLTLGGRRIDAGFLNIYNGTLTMNQAADTLVLANGGSFYGVESLSAGTMIVNGSYTTISRAPFIPGSGWHVSGSHKTVFAGTQPQQFSFMDTTLANLNHVEVTNAQGVMFPVGTTIHGLMKLVGGGRVSVNSGPLKFARHLPDIAGGTYDVMYTSIVGNVTATRSETFPVGMYIEGGGSLTLGGYRLDVPALSVRDGALAMNNAADTLIVRQYAEFYGAANLTAGTLFVRGEMRISQMPGTSSAFNASSAHTTVLDGAQTQMLYMPQDTLSHFGNLRLDNSAGVQISDDLRIRGQLMGAGGGTLRSINSNTMFIDGGLNVAGLVIEGVQVDVNGGLLTRFDNVTFQNMMVPTFVRIRHAGNTATFTMNNLTFLVPPTQGTLWVSAEDTDVATGPLTIDIVSAQAADGPANSAQLNGAQVTWRLPQGGASLRP